MQQTKPEFLRCENCTYFVQKGPRWGRCHRYPQTTDIFNGHWCGEFVPTKIVLTHVEDPGTGAGMDETNTGEESNGN